MKPQSAKAKGRRFQQYVSRALLDIAHGLEPDDIRSTSMGAPGEDIQFSPAARKQFPWSVECKSVEKLSIYRAIEQARVNARDGQTPIVLFKRNHDTPHICMPLEYFIEIYQEYLKNDEHS